MSSKSSLFNLRSPRLRRLGRFAVLGLVLWSCVAWLAARWLVTNSELQHADVLVVLSGSALYVERARWAAHLYQEGRAPRVILSNDNQRGGWSDVDEENLLFYERSRLELLRLGVPLEKIEVLEEPVASTFEEATSIRKYAAMKGFHSILFVTSSQHSRRALWTVRRVFSGSGIDVGLSVATPGANSPWPLTWWLLPRGWRIVAGEYIKLVFYWLKYR